MTTYGPAILVTGESWAELLPLAALIRAELDRGNLRVRIEWCMSPVDAEEGADMPITAPAVGYW